MDRCLARGASGSGRTDDNAESLKKRVVTFENDSKPIISLFEKKGMVKEINATENPDQVFEKVAACFVAANKAAS